MVLKEAFVANVLPVMRHRSWLSSAGDSCLLLNNYVTSASFIDRPTDGNALDVNAWLALDVSPESV